MTMRVIDGDRWLELDQSARIDIPHTLLSLQPDPGADPQTAADAYGSLTSRTR